MTSRRWWIVAVGVAGLLAIGALAIRPVMRMTGLRLLDPRGSSGTEAPPLAAIVDQVSLTHPNQKFIDLASAMLEVAGYQVDVYAGDDVTVEFYKNLATHGYRLIVFRTHSADVGPTGEIGLFTSEVYREDRWAMEQLRGRLAYGDTIPDTTGTNYFAVVPAFVQQEMRGQFKDTLVIIGGCESLASPQLAAAFLDKGASAVIGWNDTVELKHNDQAVLRLLLGIVGERMSVEEALHQTMLEVGSDPIYQSRLTFTYAQ